MFDDNLNNFFFYHRSNKHDKTKNTTNCVVLPNKTRYPLLQKSCCKLSEPTDHNVDATNNKIKEEVKDREKIYKEELFLLEKLISESMHKQKELEKIIAKNIVSKSSQNPSSKVTRLNLKSSIQNSKNSVCKIKDNNTVISNKEEKISASSKISTNNKTSPVKKGKTDVNNLTFKKFTDKFNSRDFKDDYYQNYKGNQINKINATKYSQKELKLKEIDCNKKKIITSLQNEKKYFDLTTDKNLPFEDNGENKTVAEKQAVVKFCIDIDKSAHKIKTNKLFKNTSNEATERICRQKTTKQEKEDDFDIFKGCDDFSTCDAGEPNKLSENKFSCCNRHFPTVYPVVKLRTIEKLDGSLQSQNYIPYLSNFNHFGSSNYPENFSYKNYEYEYYNNYSKLYYNSPNFCPSFRQNDKKSTLQGIKEENESLEEVSTLSISKSDNSPVYEDESSYSDVNLKKRRKKLIKKTSKPKKETYQTSSDDKLDYVKKKQKVKKVRSKSHKSVKKFIKQKRKDNVSKNQRRKSTRSKSIKKKETKVCLTSSSSEHSFPSYLKSSTESSSSLNNYVRKEKKRKPYKDKSFNKNKNNFNIAYKKPSIKCNNYKNLKIKRCFSDSDFVPDKVSKLASVVKIAPKSFVKSHWRNNYNSMYDQRNYYCNRNKDFYQHSNSSRKYFRNYYHKTISSDQFNYQNRNDYYQKSNLYGNNVKNIFYDNSRQSRVYFKYDRRPCYRRQKSPLYRTSNRLYGSGFENMTSVYTRKKNYVDY